MEARQSKHTVWRTGRGAESLPVTLHAGRRSEDGHSHSIAKATGDQDQIGLAPSFASLSWRSRELVQVPAKDAGLSRVRLRSALGGLVGASSARRRELSRRARHRAPESPRRGDDRGSAADGALARTVRGSARGPRARGVERGHRIAARRAPGGAQRGSQRRPRSRPRWSGDSSGACRRARHPQRPRGETMSDDRDLRDNSQFDRPAQPGGPRALHRRSRHRG